MKKNKNLVILISAFVALLVIYIINQIVVSNSTKATFRSVLVDVDTATVDEIQIKTKESPEAYSLKKTATGWNVEIDGKLYPADERSVVNVLQMTDLIKTKQVVAKSEDSWEQYEVNDSLGTFITIKESGAVVADFIAGKFSFTQSQNPYQRQPNVFSYIRIPGENEVYMTDGMISMTVGRKAEDFRNATLTKLTSADLTSVRFQYPADSSFVLSKIGSGWTIDGQACDSTSAVQFVNGIANKSHRQYSTAEVESRTPDYSIALAGNNMDETTIDLFVINENEIAVRSSQNSGTVFSFGIDQVKQLLKTPKDFLIQ